MDEAGDHAAELPDPVRKTKQPPDPNLSKKNDSSHPEGVRETYHRDYCPSICKPVPMTTLAFRK